MKSIIKKTFIDKDGKIIRTTTMMFCSYFIAAAMAIYSMYYNGFNINVFYAFLGTAAGSKVVDGVHTYLGKDNVPSDTTNHPEYATK